VRELVKTRVYTDTHRTPWLSPLMRLPNKILEADILLQEAVYSDIHLLPVGDEVSVLFSEGFEHEA
jgi:hypothetical protein